METHVNLLISSWNLILLTPSSSNLSKKINKLNRKQTRQNKTKETYTLGNSNICQSSQYLIRNYNTISAICISSEFTNYHSCYMLYGLKQLIRYPTHIPCTIPTLIKQILSSIPSKGRCERWPFCSLTFVLHKVLKNYTTDAAWKVSVFGVILVHIFLHSDWVRRDTECLSVFTPNAGIYGPE